MDNEDALLTQARQEIEALHRFFVEWFSGTVPHVDAIFEQNLTRRFAEDLELIPPAGNTLSRQDLIAGLYSYYGRNPDFRIAIRNVRIRVVSDDLVVACYEEWQRNAANSTPSDNGRAATVIFRRTGSDNANSLEWVQVHETWLPEEVMAAGPYNF